MGGERVGILIIVQSTLLRMSCCPQLFDVEQNFCCNEFNFKLNWYFCANTNDVVKNFAVIKSVIVKRVDCIKLKHLCLVQNENKKSL